MGKACDSVMATAKFNIHFSCNHIAGVENKTADLLSRWSYDHSDYMKLYDLV